jgi:hypothetical protein
MISMIDAIHDSKPLTVEWKNFKLKNWNKNWEKNYLSIFQKKWFVVIVGFSKSNLINFNLLFSYNNIFLSFVVK